MSQIEVRDTCQWFPLRPILDEDWLNKTDFRAGVSEMKIRGAEGCFRIDADEEEKKKREISECFHQRYLHGDKSALLKILELNPAFLAEKWVERAFDKFKSTGRLESLGYRSGRKWGGGRMPKVVVVRLVQLLEKKGYSRERAFRELQDQIPMGYNQIKSIFYTAFDDQRYEPLLFAGPWRKTTSEDIDNLKK